MTRARTLFALASIASSSGCFHPEFGGRNDSSWTAVYTSHSFDGNGAMLYVFDERARKRGCKNSPLWGEPWTFSDPRPMHPYPGKYTWPGRWTAPVIGVIAKCGDDTVAIRKDSLTHYTFGCLQTTAARCRELARWFRLIDTR